MIYVFYVTEIIPGKMAEYNELAKEMAVVIDSLGMKRVLSAMPYTGNMNQLYTVFAYDDLAQMQKMNEISAKDKDVQRLTPLMSAFRVIQTRTLL
jgi:hypothetical protein